MGGIVKIRAALVVLLLAAVCRAEPPEAIWWRAQVNMLLAPVTAKASFHAIHTEPNGSIVIDSPIVIFQDPIYDQLALFTADRLTLLPTGKLDLNQPQNLTEIQLDRPVLNLALKAPKRATTATRPTTWPSEAPVYSILQSLKSIRIHDAMIVVEAGNAEHHATLVKLDAKAVRDENGWVGTVNVECFSPTVAFTIDQQSFKFSADFSKGEFKIKSVNVRLPSTFLTWFLGFDKAELVK